MADFDLVPRGPGWATGAGESTGSQACTLADDVQVGDYVVVLSSVDYRSTEDPSSVSCPLVSTWTSLGIGRDPTSGTTRNMQVRAWLGRVVSAPSDTASRTVTVTQAGTSGQTVAARAFYGGSADATITVDFGAVAIVDRTSPFTHTAAGVSGTRGLLVVFFAGIRFTGGPPTLVGPSGMTSTVVAAATYHRAIVCTEARSVTGSTGTRDVTDSTSASGNLAGGTGLRFSLRAQGTPDPVGPEPGRYAVTRGARA